MMVILLLIACTTDASDSTGTVTGPQDLSGYATLEDLAALQEQVDQQAEELAVLRAELSALPDPATSIESATATGGCSYTSAGEVTFTDSVRILSARAGSYDADYGWIWSPVRYTVYEPTSEDYDYSTMVRITCSDIEANGLGVSAGFQLVYVSTTD